MDTTSQSQTKRRGSPLRRFFALFISLTVGSLTIVGCGDQVLPPDDDGNNVAKEYRIAYNAVLGDEFSTIATVGEKGEDRKELGTMTPITAPPGGGYAVSIDSGDDFLNIIDLQTGLVVRQIPRRYGEDINFFSAAISPDGTKIAYSIDYNDSSVTNAGRRNVIIVNSDGGNPVMLNVGAGHESYIRFSPDGNYVAFFDATRDRNGWLYVARINGTDVRRIADVERVAHDGAMFFNWSPDGKKIAYTDFEDGMMKVAAVDGSGVQSIGMGLHPDWSSDGKKILYVSATLGKVATINSDGSGEPESLGLTAIQPQWSPDGKKILYFAVVEGVELDQQVPVVSVMDMATRQSVVAASGGYYGYWIK